MDASNIATIASGIVAGLIGLAYALQKLLLNWKSNNTETSIMSMMHVELQRMSTQNTNLAKEVGTLQLQIISLSNSLTELTMENQVLKTEINRLNVEISRLHSIMEKENSNDGTS